MINYSDIELQQAAERLAHNADFQAIVEALQEDYQVTAFSSAPQDMTTRETCYQRHSMLEELKAVTAELLRSKVERQETRQRSRHA